MGGTAEKRGSDEEGYARTTGSVGCFGRRIEA